MKAKEKKYHMIVKFIVPKFAFISTQKLTKLRERYCIELSELYI